MDKKISVDTICTTVHTTQHNHLRKFLIIVIKTFCLDLLYLLLVVGVLFNISYFLFFLVAQPLLIVVEDVYVVQQMQGIALEDALGTVDISLSSTQLWTIAAEMALIVLITLVLFFVFSAYFKAKIWSLLCGRNIDFHSFVWSNSVFSFCTLLILAGLLFLFQEPAHTYLFMILFFVFGIWFAMFRYFYHNESGLKETTMQTIQKFSLFRNPLLSFISLLSAILILFLANLPLILSAQPITFFGSAFVSLILFSFIRAYYVFVLQRYTLSVPNVISAGVLKGGRE